MSDAENKIPKGPRWGKIALIVSLSVNLLIAGLAVGTFANVKRNAPPMGAGEAAGAYTFALLPKDRRDIGNALSKLNRENGSTREKIVAEYQNMIEILLADEFDRDAAEQILDRQFQFANGRRAVSEMLLLDKLEQMSKEERKAFAERLKEGANRHPGKPPRPRN